MNVSTRTLVRKFKQRVAQTPSYYIQQVRTDHAKYLLESTQLAISTIASRSGYSDEDAFRRAFRKQSSLTPTDYRRRVKRMLIS
jgi:transcriptional regulator GlxA family with amidase domain